MYRLLVACAGLIQQGRAQHIKQSAQREPKGLHTTTTTTTTTTTSTTTTSTTTNTNNNNCGACTHQGCELPL